MSERFIKFIPGAEATFLRQNYPNAFLLLSLIAERARRIANLPDGLSVGDAIIGDHESSGLTRKQYRNALTQLCELKHIEIVYKGRRNAKNETGATKNKFELKKRATKRAINGTIVNILDSRIWDLNIEREGHQKGHQGAIKTEKKGHKQERNTNKKEKENSSKLQNAAGDLEISDTAKQLSEKLKQHEIAITPKELTKQIRLHGMQNVLDHLSEMLKQTKTIKNATGLLIHKLQECP